MAREQAIKPRRESFAMPKWVNAKDRAVTQEALNTPSERSAMLRFLAGLQGQVPPGGELMTQNLLAEPPVGNVGPGAVGGLPVSGAPVNQGIEPPYMNLPYNVPNDSAREAIARRLTNRGGAGDLASMLMGEESYNPVQGRGGLGDMLGMVMGEQGNIAGGRGGIGDLLGQVGGGLGTIGGLAGKGISNSIGRALRFGR